MRELPENFEELKESYTSIFSTVINKHSIPPELVIGGDETNILFVPRASFSYAVSGEKRVRVIGVGQDKAQITATIFATEAGDVLDAQMIFGGKTTRCLPGQGKEEPPVGIKWDFTESH